MTILHIDQVIAIWIKGTMKLFSAGEPVAIPDLLGRSQRPLKSVVLLKSLIQIA